MEKQRSSSFSWKSTRFLVLSLTLSFSLVLLSFLSVWVMRARPVIHQESFLLVNTPSVSLSIVSPLKLQSLSGFNVNATNLADTHFAKPENSSGFVGNSSIVELSAGTEEVRTVGGGESKNDTELGTNFSVDRVKYLIDSHLSKPQNSSGKNGTDLGTDFSVDSVKGSILIDTHLSKPENVSGSEFLRNNSGEVGNGSSYGFVKFSMFKEDEVQSEVSDREAGEVGSNGRKNDTSIAESEQNSSSMGKDDEEVETRKVEDCDVSKGRWVFDESYPLYTNVSCPFIDEGFNCQGNGRMDNDYMKWRWQPQDCDIPRFNATNVLELIRGKRLVFAGDSINRNQWESLLCLLMGAVKDPYKVYETRGRRITKQRGTYSFRFVDYDCTIEFYVTHFLVHEGKARIGRKRKETLRIDSMDKRSSRWRGADILIFNTGNWWSHYKTKAGINYYQEGKQVYPHLDALTAYRKALVTWATWVDKYINPGKTHVFFRSTAPAHFRGGQWNNGGHCREAGMPLNEMYIDSPEKDLIAKEVIRTMKTPVSFLNVTGLSSYRIDGHPSKYGRVPMKSVSTGEDCSHWCLPGVPDAWNELIYHQLLLQQKKRMFIS